MLTKVLLRTDTTSNFVHHAIIICILNCGGISMHIASAGVSRILTLFLVC